LPLILARGRWSWHACDLARSGSKSAVRGVPDAAESSGFTAGSRQIAGKVERHPGSSYALRAEA